MAGRRRQPAGGGRNAGYGGYNSKGGYNAKQKLMNIQFRYSDVVTDYAQALLLCDGRFSLVMDDCSRAELHHLDKIEFDALMARLNVKDRASVLEMMPTIGVDSVVSLTSLHDNGTEAPPSTVPGKPPLLISPRPTVSNASGAESGPGSQMQRSSDSFGAIQEEVEGVKTSGTPRGRNGQQNGGGDDKTGLPTGNPLVTSSRSLKSNNGRLTASNGLMAPSRQQKQKGGKS